MRLIRLSDYAKIKGVTYQTANSWYHLGLIEHQTELTPRGRIMVQVPDTTAADIINGVADAMDKESKR